MHTYTYIYIPAGRTAAAAVVVTPGAPYVVCFGPPRMSSADLSFWPPPSIDESGPISSYSSSESSGPSKRPGAPYRVWSDLRHEGVRSNAFRDFGFPEGARLGSRGAHQTCAIQCRVVKSAIFWQFSDNFRHFQRAILGNYGVPYRAWSGACLSGGLQPVGPLSTCTASTCISMRLPRTGSHRRF